MPASAGAGQRQPSTQTQVQDITQNTELTTSSNMTPPDPKSLQAFQEYIEEMRKLCICNVCFHPFYEPYVLTCGHSYCYSCLSNWFGNAGMYGRSKKRCPDCRREIKVQPSPNYILRDLTHMFLKRHEFLPEGENLEYHKAQIEDEIATMAADRADRGLFKGAFKPPTQPWRRPHAIHRNGIVDQEDNVVRCPHCTWELEDGLCIHCGWGADSMDDSMSDDDDDDNSLLSRSTHGEFDEEDSELDHEIDLLDHALDEDMVHALRHDLIANNHEDAISITDTESEDDHDTDNEMDDYGPAPRSRVIHRGVIPFTAGDESDSDSDSDSSTLSDETATTGTTTARQTQSPRSMLRRAAETMANLNRPRPPPVFYGPGGHDTGTGSEDDTTSQSTNYDESDSEDSSEEDEDNHSLASPSPPRTRRPTRVVISDDEDEEEEEDEDRTPQPPNHTNPTVESVSDEDSDDTAIRPPHPVRNRPPQPPQVRRQRLDFQRARRNMNQNSDRNNATFQTASAYARGNDGRGRADGIQGARRAWPMRVH